MATKPKERADNPAPDELTPVEKDAGITLALQAFSAELAQRLPDRFIKRFVMPSTIRQCCEVFFVEMTSRDEVNAAQMADAVMTPIERSSVRLTNMAEEREAMRCTVVGLGRVQNGVVVYEHVNHDGVPFAEPNDWPQKVWTCLRAFFGQLNGVPADELTEGILGARIVGAFAPPTSVTPASAADGK